MKYGVREICDVVLKTRSAQKIGNKIFYKDEPVLYFDSLKTSSLEGAATTVYAQGGRGNARLMAWEGERTLTFNMEDALISPESLAILTGADITEASYGVVIEEEVEEVPYQYDINKVILSGIPVYDSGIMGYYYDYSHEGNISKLITTLTSQGFYIGIFDNNSSEEVTGTFFVPSQNLNSSNHRIELGGVTIGSKPIEDDKLENYSLKVLKQKTIVHKKEIITPKQIITTHVTETTDKITKNGNNVNITLNNIPSASDSAEVYVMPLKANEILTEPYIGIVTEGSKVITLKTTDDLTYFNNCDAVLVDYYIDRISNTMQIDITPDKFGGTYYLEASTLFKDTNGTDVAAEFVIPKCKIQSNFTFTMASSGDPSTFNFVLDAFPEYTRFDKTKKVLAAIQIVSDTIGVSGLH